MKKYFLIFTVLILPSGCTQPLPEERLNYVGKWQSYETELSILTDGRVEYKHKKGGSTTTINAPIKEFVGNDFVVGVLFITTKFVVSEPPHEVDGKWMMTVDGTTLIRTSE